MIIKPNNELWGTAPIQEWLGDPGRVFHMFDDFVFFNDEESTGQSWDVRQIVGSGAASIIDAAHGVLEIDSNATTAGRGVQVQLQREVVEIEQNKPIWFEARCAFADLGTNQADIRAFIGLASFEAFWSGTVAAASDRVGFEVLPGDQANADRRGKLHLRSLKGDAGTPGAQLGIYTIPAAADYAAAKANWVRLGMKIDNVGSTFRVQGYVNGVAIGNRITTEIPDGIGITPTFSCVSNGTSDPILFVDWVRLMQVRE